MRDPENQQNVQAQGLVAAGKNIRREIDERFTTRRVALSPAEEISVDDIVRKHISFPSSFQDVEIVLEAAGFKVFKSEALGISRGFSAVISKYMSNKSPFGVSYGIYLHLETVEMNKPSKVLSIDGAILSSSL